MPRIICCGRSTGSSIWWKSGGQLAPFYSTTGRPSIDPELMIRMLIVGYCYRHPLRAAAVRGGSPEPGLSLVLPARARRQGAGPLDLLAEPARPLPAERHPAASVRDGGRTLHGGRAGGRRRLRGRCQPDRCRRQQAAVGSGRRLGAGTLGAKAGRAVREYLATLDDAAFGAASEVTPKFISPSDPAAQWTGAHKGHAFFAYATNYLIDTDSASSSMSRPPERSVRRKWAPRAP